MIPQILLALLCAAAVSCTSLCPAGFQEGGDGTCYGVITTPATFKQAADICQQHGGFVATVSNGFENSFLRGMIANLSSAWIGYYCPANQYNCQWEDGTRVYYENINQRCTRDQSKEACGFMQPSGYWCNSACSVPRPFICRIPDPAASPCYGWTKNPNFNNNCFRTFNQNATETAAEQICQQNCGHLAYISVQSDNTIVANLLCKECDNSPLFTRIGLIDNGDNNYTWTNGHSFNPSQDYSNFGEIIPSLGNCVNMALRNTTVLQAGQWINADCNQPTAFTCMRPQGQCVPVAPTVVLDAAL